MSTKSISLSKGTTGITSTTLPVTFVEFHLPINHPRHRPAVQSIRLEILLQEVERVQAILDQIAAAQNIELIPITDITSYTELIQGLPQSLGNVS